MQKSTANLLSEICLEEIRSVSCKQNSVRTFSKNPKTIDYVIRLMLKNTAKLIFFEREGYYQLIVGKKSPIIYRAFLKYQVTCKDLFIKGEITFEQVR